VGAPVGAGKGAGSSSRAGGTYWCHDERVRVWLRALVAWGVFALTCVLVAVGGLLSARVRGGWAQPADAVLALAFTGAGALIVTRRGNRLGWLALLMGLSGVAYAADSYARWAVEHGAPGAAWSAWLGLWVWAPAWLSLGTVLLLLIPDGRLPSPRWRPLLVLAWALIAAFTVVAAVLPAQAAGSPVNPLAVPALGGVARHGVTVVLVLLLVLAAGCLWAVVSRLRRSAGVVRLQLVWICAGAVITIVTLLGGAVFPAAWVTPVQSAGAVALPACLGVAVLRHNLYEIDPVLRRSLTYGLLVTALGLAAVGLVAFGGLLVGSGRPAVAVVATVVIALAVNPAYRLVSRAVDRMLYGSRSDPYLVLSALGRRLAATTDPGQILDALARAAAEMVQSPYVEAEAAGGLLRVGRGTPQPVAISIPLVFHGATLGWLRLAARSPGEPFDPRDRQLLDDTAAQAGAAVCAAVTELDLRAARERLVASREEERRQLRRDLHDGVGPVLAGLGFTAEAAARALPADPARAGQVLSSVQQQASIAVTAVRQISRELRPAPLAELGLAGAIRQLADPAADAGMDVSVVLPDDIAELPAAVEVAAYHIAAEAVTNALRHSRAARLTVELCRAPDRLVLRVTDDGTGIPAGDGAGVGLTSMRQRAEELGGAWSVRSAAGTGTTVEATLPLPEGTGCPYAC
jgi:two-component system, NarL family, sensor kinase